MPSCRATASAARRLSPVSSTGREAEVAQFGDGGGRSLLDGVGDDDDRADLAVDRQPDRGLPVGLGRCRPHREARRARRAPTRRAASCSVRRRVTCSSTTPVTPLPPWFSKSVTGGSGPASAARAATARPIGCSDACSRAPASRSISGSDASSAACTDVTVIWPVVTVPVLSSTTVSMRRVDSSTCGPLIRMPNCAPRPVPTSRAVGVASPSAHGHAMISTATAAVKAAEADPPMQQPGGKRQQGQPDDDRNEDRRDPVGQPLHLGLAALGFGDEPGDLGELGVGADAGRADLEPSSDVDRRADDAVAGAHLDGHGLTGQHRRVHRRRARNHDAVGGDLLAGARDEDVADGELVYGNACFGRSVAQDGDVLGAHVEQCAQRRAGLPLGARLEIAPGEDEGGDGRGDFQIEMGSAVVVRQRGSASSSCRVCPHG